MPPLTQSQTGRLRPLLVAQVWAFLFFLPALAPLTHPGNRYLLFWRSSSPAIHLACVVALGAGLSLACALLRKLSTKGYPLAVVIIACALLAGEARAIWEECRKTSAAFAHVYSASLALGSVCLALAAWQWRWTPARITSWIERATLFVSPLVPIFWVNLFLAPTFDPPRTASAEPESRGPVSAREPDGDIYILILDAWSYRLTYEDGKVRPEMPRLAEAASAMCSFSDAHAPGCHTITSLPRFLFQREGDFALRGDEVGFWDGSFIPVKGLRSIFHHARSEGYRTYMIGWYHPYELMVGDHVDVVASSNAFHWLGEEPFQIGVQLYEEAARKILGRSLLRSLSREALYRKNHVFVRNTDFVMSHVRSIIEESGTSRFAVFHIPVPHFPFCYSAEGSRPLEKEYSLESAELAREQLAYTDRLIGEIIDRLKRLGKYERATIVLTSDHTWRNDPELPPRSARHWSHVPLLIKFPGQEERIDVDVPFTTSRLERLLEAVRRTGHDLSHLPAILSAESFHVAIADEEADLSRVMPLLK